MESMESLRYSGKQGQRSVSDTLHTGIVAWVVLAVSVVITVAGWAISSAYVQQRANDRFHYLVESTSQSIAKRMQEYEQVLRGGIGLFKASSHVDRSEWREYVSTLLIDTYWPGIQGIGFAEMIRPDELQAHEKRVRAEGFPQYRVKPVGERDLYSSIIYLEPFSSRNLRAFGYDMYSNSIRREAMQRACSTGEPAISGRVTLVQETSQDVQAGFLVYLPLFKEKLPLSTPQERCDAVRGYVYSPFRTKDMLHGILGNGTIPLHYQVYDGSEQRPDSQLYDSREELGYREQEGGFDTVQTLQMQGRTWTLRYHSTKSFDEELFSSQPLLIAIGGVAVDVLLFAVIMSMARNRVRMRRQTLQLAEALDKLTESEQRMHHTHQLAKVGSWQLNMETQQLLWTEETYQIFGLAPGAPITRQRFLGMIHQDDRDDFDKAWQSALNGKPFDLEHRICLEPDEVRWVHERADFHYDENQQPVSVQGSVQDVTERKQFEQALLLSAQVIQSARECIMVTNADAHLIDVNPMFTEMTGYSREEVLGRSPSILSSGRHDKAFYQQMWVEINREGSWIGEIWNRHKSGSLYLERINISAVTDTASGEVLYYVGIASDITEAYLQREKMEHMAHHDTLTDLPNRQLLMDRLEVAIAHAKRSHSPILLGFVDLDGFKPINDQLGHAAGDQALIEVAARLRNSLRAEDTIARIGGDEFALLLSNTGSDEFGKGIIEKVLTSLSAPYRINQTEVLMSASIGVALYPEDGIGASELLNRADNAMYVAKKGGKGRACLSDGTLWCAPVS